MCVGVSLGRMEVQSAGAPLLTACILIISRIEEVCRSYLRNDTILKTSPVLRIRSVDSGA